MDKIVMQIEPKTDDKGRPYSVLNIGDGTRDKRGELRGHSKGAGFWGMVAQYIRAEGADVFLLHIDEYLGTTAATPTPPPTVPEPVAPVAPLPVATVATPLPTPAPTVAPPVPAPTVAAPPAPPKGKANQSLDYCPRRATHKGLVIGLLDGTLYRWFTPAGDAPHYRKYKGRDTAAVMALFASPAPLKGQAPTLKAAAPTVPAAPTPTVATPLTATVSFDNLPLGVFGLVTLPSGGTITLLKSGIGIGFTVNVPTTA